jgi:hypothetical protein
LQARGTGFQAGIATSAHLNKVWRQAAAVAAMVGKFIADRGVDVWDNGDLAGLEWAYRQALHAVLEADPIVTSIGTDLTGIHASIDNIYAQLSGIPPAPDLSGYATIAMLAGYATTGALGGYQPLVGSTIWTHANSAFAAGSTGYLHLPNGLILMWGEAQVSAIPTWVPFPTAFPAACDRILVSEGAGNVEAWSAGKAAVHAAGARTPNGYEAYALGFNPSGNYFQGGTYTQSFLAIGR